MAVPAGAGACVWVRRARVECLVAGWREFLEGGKEPETVGAVRGASGETCAVRYGSCDRHGNQRTWCGSKPDPPTPPQAKKLPASYGPPSNATTSTSALQRRLLLGRGSSSGGGSSRRTLQQTAGSGNSSSSSNSSVVVPGKAAETLRAAALAATVRATAHGACIAETIHSLGRMVLDARSSR